MPKRAVFEKSRRELSLDVSVGVRILLVAEQPSLESQSRGCAKTPTLMVLWFAGVGRSSPSQVVRCMYVWSSPSHRAEYRMHQPSLSKVANPATTHGIPPDFRKMNSSVGALASLPTPFSLLSGPYSIYPGKIHLPS